MVLNLFKHYLTRPALTLAVVELGTKYPKGCNRKFTAFFVKNYPPVCNAVTQRKSILDLANADSQRNSV